MEKEKRTTTITEGEIDKQAKEFGESLKGELKVRVKIPIDKQNKDDMVVPVCINGYVWQIKRGEAVMVPQIVQEVLENAGYI